MTDDATDQRTSTTCDQTADLTACWPASTTTRTRSSAPTDADHTVIRTTAPRPSRWPPLVGGERYPMSVHVEGVFAVAVPGTRLDRTTGRGRYGWTARKRTCADPYRFLPTLGELDLHLIAEGRHERLWEVLGAHPRTSRPDRCRGVSFAVWAPNAKGVG